MVIKVHDVLVVQRSVQLDFSVNLAEGENKISNELNNVFCLFLKQDSRLWLKVAARVYLLALVRLGDARVRDDFGRVNFAGGQVGHLVALCETSLC